MLGRIKGAGRNFTGVLQYNRNLENGGEDDTFVSAVAELFAGIDVACVDERIGLRFGENSSDSCCALSTYVAVSVIREALSSVSVYLGYSWI